MRGAMLLLEDKSSCHPLCCFSVPTGEFLPHIRVKRSRGVYASRTEPASYSLWRETGWVGRNEEAHTGPFQGPEHNFCPLAGSLLPRGLRNCNLIQRSQRALSVTPPGDPVLAMVTFSFSFPEKTELLRKGLSVGAFHIPAAV